MNERAAREVAFAAKKIDGFVPMTDPEIYGVPWDYQAYVGGRYGGANVVAVFWYWYYHSRGLILEFIEFLPLLGFNKAGRMIFDISDPRAKLYETITRRGGTKRHSHGYFLHNAIIHYYNTIGDN